MIEQAMIFALGFLIAGVLALAVMPAIWRRALRLSGRRLEMQLPLSAGEIRAERDHVRAEAAVTQRRIEQKLDAVNTARAGDMGELGRRATALAAADTAHAALSGELATTRRALNETTATAFATEKALFDLHGQHARTQGDLAALRDAHDELQLLADGRRASAVALEARSASLQLRLDDLHETIGRVESRLATKSHEAAKLVQDVAAARSEIAQMTAARDTLEKRFAAETARRETLQSAHGATQQEFEGAAAELRATKGRLDMEGRSLADARTQLDAALQKHEAMATRARDGESAATAKIDAMRAENAAAQGALEVARQENMAIAARAREGESAATARLDAMRAEHAATQGALERARQELAQLHQSAAPGAADDASLRQSIREVGAAIVRMSAEAAKPATKPASEAPRSLAGLRISDLRPQPAPAAVASAAREPT